MHGTVKMDRIYSKKALALKAVYCFLLPPVYLLLSSLITAEEPVLYVFLTFFPVGCAYTVPFWVTLSHIKKFPVKSIKAPVLYDLAFCLAPASLGAVLSEVVSVAVNGSDMADGFAAVALATIFALISGTFFLLYRIESKR